MTSSVIFVMCAIDHKSPVPHSVRELAEGSLVARATVVVDKVAMLCLNPSWKTPYYWCQNLLRGRLKRNPNSLKKDGKES